jgi:hypothetical protein
MKVLVLLPPTPEPAVELVRRLAWVERRFEGADITLSADKTSLAHYERELGVAILEYIAGQTAAHTDILVLVKGRGAPQQVEAPELASQQRLYVQEPDGRLALLDRPFDDLEIADVEAHTFSRLAPRREAGYYYFPYGYLAHYPGMGPVTSLGFRAGEDWDVLSSRAPSHKLIVVSGGSSVWSQCCLPDEAFPAVLEQLLNEWSGASDRRMRFTVLNFGLFGNLVLHQTINYLLFAERLRPDCVIAHDGFNDLVFGLMSDPWLLTEHSIAYQPQFESWAEALYRAPGRPPPSRRVDPYPLRNLPHVAVRAYIDRKQQLQRIVEAGSTSFVWGLQPCIFSKGALSAAERAIVAQPPSGIYDRAHARLDVVYEQFLAQFRAPSERSFVNCHAAFKEFGGSEQLFADYVHTTPAGDRKIAGLYFDVLSRRFDRDCTESAAAPVSP